MFQQPHLKNNTAKDEKDSLEQFAAWDFIYISFHLFKEYSRVQIEPFCSLKLSD